MVKNYKKIITDKIKVIKVDSYDELINKLKSYNIKPQEAFNLAYKNKYQYNARYFWTMTKIGMYKNQRVLDLILVRIKLFPVAKQSKTQIKKNEKKSFKLLRMIDEAKKIEKKIKKLKGKDYTGLKSRLAKLETKLEDKWKLKGLPEQKKRSLYKKNEYEFNEGAKKMPKKIDTCKTVVASKEFKEEFKSFYPNEKFDERKEVQNLHKLVTEKRHRNKLFKKDREFTINKPMKNAIILEEIFGNRLKRIL